MNSFKCLGFAAIGVVVSFRVLACEEYRVSLPENDPVEYRFYCDTFHFGTLLLDNGLAAAFRPHPDRSASDGWGSSWYLSAYIQDDLAPDFIDAVSSDANGIHIQVSGAIANGAGRWSANGVFTYDSAMQKVAASGALAVNLNAPLEAIGDLSLGRIASNYLHNVPLQIGGVGNTGDMRRVTINYGSDGNMRNFKWTPSPENPRHYPSDASHTLAIEVVGELNVVDALSQGSEQIKIARKPNLSLTFSPVDANTKLSPGLQWNALENASNVGMSHLLLRGNSFAATQMIFNFQMLSGRPPPSETAFLKNVSTRGWVGTEDNIMIGGFIVSGSGPKQVLITAKGPALAEAGVPSVLNDPHLTLYNASGQPILGNDHWVEAPNAADIQGHSAGPRYNQEAAILTTLNPGAYTAIVRGAGATTGNALVEVYDLQTNNATSPRLTNLSTRGWVGTEDSIMIGGFIVSGSGPKQVLITAKGPALAEAGVPSVLNDPHLTLYNASGQPILGNDHWVEAPNAADIQGHSAGPRYSQEAAILTTLSPGAYTAIVRGAGATTGNALVEVYELY